MHGVEILEKGVELEGLIRVKLMAIFEFEKDGKARLKIFLYSSL